MKKIIFFFSFAFIVIAAVMIYLVKVGVSIRPAMYIKPSPMTEGLQTVARDVSLRLFPDLQTDDYLVWGLPEASGESQQLVQLLQAEEERARGKKITIFPSSSPGAAVANAPDLALCVSPCWILRKQDQAHELSPNRFISEQLRPLVEKNGKHYFTLTVIPFQFGTPVPDECWGEKRLDFRCIQLVSIQANEKKVLKDRASGAAPAANTKRYFFMNKYNEGDFFLFIETPALR
jgi:hypothetical protein